jgi:hypothetical protein
MGFTDKDSLSLSQEDLQSRPPSPIPKNARSAELPAAVVNAWGAESIPEKIPAPAGKAETSSRSE